MTSKKVTLKFPCGHRAKFDLKDVKEKIYDNYHGSSFFDVEINTRDCASFKDSCTNKDGHLNVLRIGTGRHPHCDILCRGTDSLTDSRVEQRVVLRFARSKFGQHVKVWWHEPSVYEVVDQSDSFLGYVLLPGAHEKFHSDNWTWHFFKVP